MGVPSDAAVSPGDYVRQIVDVKSDVAQARTARRGQATSIGAGGMRYHSGGSATFEGGGGINVRDGGDVVIEGGGDITLEGGGLLTVQDGSRIVVRYPDGATDAAYFGYLTDGSETVGYGILVNGEGDRNLFRAREHVTDGRQVIIGGVYPAADFQVYADDTLIQGQSLDVAASADVDIDAGGHAFITGVGQAAFGGGAGTFLQPLSGSGTANVRMDTTTGQITWVASTERVKTDIRDLELDPGVVLQLRPRSWLPGPTVTQCPEWLHAQHGEGECRAGEVVEPPADVPREVGFVAEEIDALGLSDFVEYDADGAPSSIRYDRLTAALVPLLQAQQQQINDLTARLDALEQPTEA
jgi:hypothetical protein